MKRESVLHVVAPQREGAIGGSDLHVRDLARAQKEDQECDVSVLALRAPQHYLDLLAVAGLDVIHEARDLRRLARLPSERHVTVVHSHGYEASYLVAALRVVSPDWRRLPTVMTAHGWIETTTWLRIKSALDRLACRGAHVRIASAARHMSRLRGRGETRVIHNGVPVPPGAPELRIAGNAAWRLRNRITYDRPMVGLVGRLSAEKRPDLFLRMAYALVHDYDARFLLVGGGEMRDSLVALAEQLDITDMITFTGLVDDIHSVYRELDILVQPSDTEGTPRTILEAMANGVPVVATNVGDVGELLDHGGCGVLAERGDLADLTAAVAKLLDDPVTAQQLAERGRERYFDHFTIEVMAARVHDAYQAAVDLAYHRTRVRGG